MKQSQHVRLIVLIYYILLYVLWACLECIIVPKLELPPVSIEAVKEIGCKILLWSIPAILLILRYDDSLFLHRNELSGDPKKPVTYLPLCMFALLFTAYFLFLNYYENGKIVISPSFHPADIPIALSIGIGEELVFRGLLLNAALKDRNPWIVCFGNAVMFLMIHFPIWLREGVFLHNITNFTFLMIIVLSLIFSWTFVKSRSMIVPVILHAYWDLLCVVMA
ncbi:MAG: CPBP family intramembrane metalloprotease [Oscillospiraceae bacterium]|nr:CPBP family intramembrane metalloprotease [Oscillospiraceae bacterium]